MPSVFLLSWENDEKIWKVVGHLTPFFVPITFLNRLLTSKLLFKMPNLFSKYSL
jgi:hypothetical protein